MPELRRLHADHAPAVLKRPGFGEHRQVRHDRRRARLPTRALDCSPREEAGPACLRCRPGRRRCRLGVSAGSGDRADSQCPALAHPSRWRVTLPRVCYWAPQQTLANRAVNHKAGQRAEDLKRVATTLVLLAYSELVRHFDPKHSPLVPTMARHLTRIILPVGTCQTLIPNSFSAFRNAIFSLASRGKATPRNQSVWVFIFANG